METGNQSSDLPSSGRVFVMENHDRAYALWRARGEKERVLVHLDAHHDMWWTPGPESVSIANFICPALQEDIVREIYWIVPDGTWQTGRGRRAVVGHLKAILKGYPGPSSAIRRQEDEISTSVLGKPLRVRPLASLPALSEAVLLDIDVDFLLIPRVTYRESDEQGALPWCWPEELNAKLRAGGIRSGLVTVAYSVEGGFTPLKWKYLGDELALRLEPSGRTERNSPGLCAMAAMREGAVAARRSDFAAAEAAYARAAKLMPASPAPCYHLAYLYLELGRTAEAREVYQRTLELDPSYQTPYRSPGLKHHSERRFDEARREYQRSLALDAEDACALYGLARLAVRQKLWREAERLIEKSIAADREFTDAYRVLGDVLVKQHRLEPAIAAYERSLKLALAGHKPLGEPIATFTDERNRIFDPGHGEIHARVARLYEMRGALAEAINGYQIGIAGGDNGLATRSRLARAYARQKQWGRAAHAAGRALGSIPKSLRRAFHRRIRRMKLDLSAGAGR